MVKNERQNWIEEKWKEINKARDASEWWGAINKFRAAKRKSITSNITDE